MSKRYYAALAFVTLAGASTLRAQAPEPPKPGPEHQKLAYFVGRWNIEGTVQASPMGPAGSITATDTCEWFAGGFHIVCKSDGRGPAGEMHGLNLLGYNAEKKRYTYYGIDNSGWGDGATGEVVGDTWNWESEATYGGQVVKTRYTIKQLSPDSYTWRLETSMAGGPWTLGGEGRETRVK
jgi:hypothetical protein